MTIYLKNNEYWKPYRINVGTTTLTFPLFTSIPLHTIRTVEKSNRLSYSTVGRCLRIFPENVYYLRRKVNGRRAIYRPYNDLSPPILCTRAYGQHVRGHPPRGRTCSLQNGDGVL